MEVCLSLPFKLLESILSNTTAVYPIREELFLNSRHNSNGLDHCIIYFEKDDLKVTEVWLIADSTAI